MTPQAALAIEIVRELAKIVVEADHENMQAKFYPDALWPSDDVDDETTFRDKLFECVNLGR